MLLVTLMCTALWSIIAGNWSVAAAPQDGFAFLDTTEESPGQRNSQNKVPLLAPWRCAENELLYPADFNDDWVCDCKQGYLFHPASQRCHEPHRQGPCPAGHTLWLPPGTFSPQCGRNPCGQGDGYVRLRGACYLLGTVGPCPLGELSYVVSLNVTTLQPACLSLGEPKTPSLQMRFDDDETTTTTAKTIGPVQEEVMDPCPVGSRRWLRKECTNAMQQL